MKAYRFKDWSDLFENNRSREIENLTYFLQPNKLNGECIGFMLQQPDGLELYGILGLLKCLASTAQRKYRGWLVRNGTPMDAARMSYLTGVEAAKIAHALEFFSSPPMDWLICEEWQPHGTGTSSAPRRHPNDTAPAGQRHGTPSAPRRHPKGTNSTGLRTDIGLTDTENKKQKGSFANGAEAMEAQTRQFAAADARRGQLEGIGEGERSEGEELELKKMRALVRAIQKKQRAGDFTPVLEDEL